MYLQLKKEFKNKKNLLKNYKLEWIKYQLMILLNYMHFIKLNSHKMLYQKKLIKEKRRRNRMKKMLKD